MITKVIKEKNCAIILFDSADSRETAIADAYIQTENGDLHYGYDTIEQIIEAKNVCAISTDTSTYLDMIVDYLQKNFGDLGRSKLFSHDISDVNNP